MFRELIRFSRLPLTRFSIPEYVWTTYQSPIWERSLPRGVGRRGRRGPRGPVRPRRRGSTPRGGHGFRHGRVPRPLRGGPRTGRVRHRHRKGRGRWLFVEIEVVVGVSGYVELVL